ncbi:hypothetical protein [Hydrogenophaga taeniospiralis]|uniref:hypothetical protein n=1 Tax=Hydrogenophaga taeniospiralis TaxID=65656 RepID=UPI001CFA4D03|nr:hypothetical protein [Hydrogenophaga taeniospiralis]UCU92655.1 hypothetical protein KI616_17700 [Hydrogenophaga taeniospiralis]
MPYYRLALGMVHMRGTRLPPPCAARILIDGQDAQCLAMSAYLCDGPPPPHRQGDYQDSGTCDAPLCEAHARQTGPNRHLCPACHQTQRDAEQQRSLFTSLV